MLFKTTVSQEKENVIKKHLDLLHHSSTKYIKHYPLLISAKTQDEWLKDAQCVAELIDNKRHYQNTEIPYATACAEEASCLTIDYAVAQEHNKTTLKLIELQAYPITLHMGFDLERLYNSNNKLGELSLSDRESLFHKCLYQGESNTHTIMLTQTITQLSTSFDFISAKRRGEPSPVLLSEIYRHNGQWWYMGQHGPEKIKRIYSRIIFNKTQGRERDILIDMLNDPHLTWFNHPVWFEKINKSSLRNLSHPSNPAVCLPEDPLPDDLTSWVLKRVDSHSGNGIVISPSREQVVAAKGTHSILQQRVQYAHCIPLQDHKPLCAEIRISLIKNKERKWIPIQILSRNSIDGDVSKAMKRLLPGEGMTVVLLDDQ